VHRPQRLLPWVPAYAGMTVLVLKHKEPGGAVPPGSTEVRDDPNFV